MFTKRQIEILRLIAKGISTPAIADRLFISEHTVKTHKKNISLKARIFFPQYRSQRKFAVWYVREHCPPE